MDSLTKQILSALGNNPAVNPLGLNKETDSVNVGKMTKGPTGTAHSAITATATSAEIDARGYNAILIQVRIAAAVKLWTTKLTGSIVSGGVFTDIYEQANTGSMVLMSYQTNSNKMFLFKGIPDFIKIVATEDEDGANYSADYLLLNV